MSPFNSITEQTESLRAERELTKKLQAEIEELKEEKFRLKKANTMLKDEIREDYWHWQGDGTDHIESLCCPILIHPEDMKKLQTEIKALKRPMEAANFKTEGMLAVGNELIDRDMKINQLQAEIKKLKESPRPDNKEIEKTDYPIQDGDNIPEWLAKIVYQGYLARYGKQQSYERLRERGGFGQVEVVWLLNCLVIKSIEDAEQKLKNNKS